MSFETPASRKVAAPHRSKPGRVERRRWPLLIDPSTIPAVMAVLPLRNSVFFPGGVLPLAVGRPKTIALIKDAIREDAFIAIVTQRRAEEEDPGPDDLYRTGTLARIVKLLKLGEDNYSLVVQGLARLRVLEFVSQTPYLQARVEHVREPPAADSVEAGAFALELRKATRQLIELMPEMPAVASELVESVTHPGHLADLIAANVDVPLEHKQSVLETEDLARRMRMVLDIVALKRELLLRAHQIAEEFEPVARQGGERVLVAEVVLKLLRDRRSAAGGTPPPFQAIGDAVLQEPCCSFCGLPPRPARLLVQGGPAAICEGCLASAAKALASHVTRPPRA